MPNETTNAMPIERADLAPSDTREEIADPQSNSEVYYGSFSSILMQNLGQYVVIEFIVGTEKLEIKEGILYSAGINFVTLYDPSVDRYTVCDLYSVKFVTFYNTTSVPPSRAGQLNNSLSLNQWAPNGGYSMNLPSSRASTAEPSGVNQTTTNNITQTTTNTIHNAPTAEVQYAYPDDGDAFPDRADDGRTDRMNGGAPLAGGMRGMRGARRMF